MILPGCGTSLCDMTYCVISALAGRDRFLDKLEEKVTQAEVELAITDLNAGGNWNVREFMVGADVAARRHVWALAVQGEGGDAEEAGRLLDGTLRELNADYAT